MASIRFSPTIELADLRGKWPLCAHPGRRVGTADFQKADKAYVVRIHREGRDADLPTLRGHTSERTTGRKADALRRWPGGPRREAALRLARHLVQSLSAGTTPAAPDNPAEDAWPWLALRLSEECDPEELQLPRVLMHVLAERAAAQTGAQAAWAEAARRCLAKTTALETPGKADICASTPICCQRFRRPAPTQATSKALGAAAEGSRSHHGGLSANTAPGMKWGDFERHFWGEFSRR